MVIFQGANLHRLRKTVELWLGSELAVFFVRFNYFAASFLPCCENRTGDLYANIFRVSRERSIQIAKTACPRSTLLFNREDRDQSGRLDEISDVRGWLDHYRSPTQTDSILITLGGTTTEARQLCQI